LYNTCFFQGEELGLGDAVFLWVQPPGAGENGGRATCVDSMYHSVQRIRRCCARSEQLWELLE